MENTAQKIYVCQTCTDDAVCAELFSQILHVGFTMGVELPAGDTQVKAQPGGVAGTAAVPPGILVSLVTISHPGQRVQGEYCFVRGTDALPNRRIKIVDGPIHSSEDRKCHWKMQSKYSIQIYYNILKPVVMLQV